MRVFNFKLVHSPKTILDKLQELPEIPRVSITGMLAFKIVDESVIDLVPVKSRRFS
jgi:hypothetical protein